MIVAQEVFMKLILKTVLLTTVLAGLFFNPLITANNSTAAETAISSKNTQSAVSELSKLGVPLQKDPEGNVRWIEAREGEFTDESLSLLPKLPKLEWLEIGNGIISPDGMKHVGECKSLKRLYIHDIVLKGAKLDWLSKLDKLEALSLQRTQIDGTFIKYLSTTGTLKVLNLSRDNISDNDMDKIAHFKNLEVLALSDTQVTGAGIKKLEGMTRLNELNISNCTVQDYDLNTFLTMPNLRIVYAEGCNISDMTIGNIVAQFPMLAIFR
jgi:Leucine-rich repeat (LRR) protein